MDIKDLRNKIDFADQRLLRSFVERMRVSEEIAGWKRAHGAPLCDPVREAEKLDAASSQLPADLRGYGRRLYALLFQLSKEHQAESAPAAETDSCAETSSDTETDSCAETSSDGEMELHTKADSPADDDSGCSLPCGLLGKTLQHSYSPRIHQLLNAAGVYPPRTGLSEDCSAGYDYRLFEVAPEKLDEFLKSGPFGGLNVTIPYKKEVAKRCRTLSETAQKLGSVNTVVRQEDGALCGDNTDYFGFAYLLKKSGVDPRGKRAVVLGSGGASVTVRAVLEEQGASVKVVSRKGQYHYGDPSAFADAQVLVNTTPVGMYPENGQIPVDLRLFPQLEAVLDIVYNPARTALLLQAEELGIPGFGGLAMLVAQAWKSRQIFLGGPVLSLCHTQQPVPGKDVMPCKDTLPGRDAMPGRDAEERMAELSEANVQKQIDQVTERIASDLQNLVFVGMAGSGKTTLGRAVAQKLGRPFFDSDAEFEQRTGMSPEEYIPSHGEAAFRRLETEVLAQLGKKSGAVIATGGGAVTRPENYPLLHQNGRIFWVRRSPELLATAGRPLSQKAGPEALYAEREPLYRRFCDEIIENNSTIDVTVGRFFCHKKTP